MGGVDMSSRDDDSAVRRLAMRDDGVVELFRQRRQPMVRLAYTLTRDAELSDEIVQDAFLQLHEKWAAVDNPAGYLRTAVVNSCHSHHRHLQVVRKAPIEHVVPPAATDAVDEELVRAIARLPFRQQAVLALRYFSDLEDVEIAATLGISRATVRTRAHRGLDRLRKEIRS